jgi:HAD superfamily hydrolase (TIGR01484 family)
MIKGLILDVDGVLTGKKKGYNYPLPHPSIIETLKILRKKNIIVTLCTGRGTFTLNEIVNLAHLDNVHIGDAGAMVIDILDNKIIDKHLINQTYVLNIIQNLTLKNIYTELYTQNGYYVQKNLVNDITEIHTNIINKKPSIIDSLENNIKELSVVKITLIVNNEIHKNIISEWFTKYYDVLELHWAVAPAAPGYQFALITMKNISKKQAAILVSQYSKVPLNEMLGVGDGMLDWEFMQVCGYVGAMGNASQELKDKVLSKGEYGYIGKSVDENGLLDILLHFGLEISTPVTRASNRDG